MMTAMKIVRPELVGRPIIVTSLAEYTQRLSM